MKRVLDHISQRAQRLGHHDFFATLEQPEPDLQRAMAFAPNGMFWVLVFQDIIRLNTERANDPFVRRLLDQHRREDTGHEYWFFEDVEGVFGVGEYGVRWLFSPRNLGVREVSYALVSEVYRIEDDNVRLVLVEALEAAAGVYFSRFSAFLQASGHAERLKYFAGVHLRQEGAHEIHGDESVELLHGIDLSEESLAAAIAMVDRMFAAFERLSDFLLSLRSPS